MRRPRKLRRLRKLQNSDSSDSSTGPRRRSSATPRRSVWCIYLHSHSAASHFASGRAGVSSLRKRWYLTDFAALQLLCIGSIDTTWNGWFARKNLLLSRFRLFRGEIIASSSLNRTISPSIIATMSIASCILVSRGGQTPDLLTPQQLTPTLGKSANH
jgi:hypothetical protein